MPLSSIESAARLGLCWSVRNARVPTSCRPASGMCWSHSCCCSAGVRTAVAAARGGSSRLPRLPSASSSTGAAPRRQKPRRATTRPDLVLYDGQCGLCHGWVRFLLRRDPAGILFRFRPLSDSSSTVIVETADARRLERSDAVLYLLARLGGAWRALAASLRLMPKRLRDRIYDWVAAVRYRLAPAPLGVCPAVPPDLRDRFLL
jgi:predicted DCC family thiol-disulfide oxidoreductase YuxK